MESTGLYLYRRIGDALRLLVSFEGWKLGSSTLRLIKEIYSGKARETIFPVDLDLQVAAAGWYRGIKSTFLRERKLKRYGRFSVTTGKLHQEGRV